MPTALVEVRRRYSETEEVAIMDAVHDALVAACDAKSGEFTAVDTAADDVALFGATSGTTGVPKITMHFHRDILANADTFAKHVLHLGADDVSAVDVCPCTLIVEFAERVESVTTIVHGPTLEGAVVVNLS